MTLDITAPRYNGTFDITSLGVGPYEEKVFRYNVTSSFLVKKIKIQTKRHSTNYPKSNFYISLQIITRNYVNFAVKAEAEISLHFLFVFVFLVFKRPLNSCGVWLASRVFDAKGRYNALTLAILLTACSLRSVCFDRKLRTADTLKTFFEFCIDLCAKY